MKTIIIAVSLLFSVTLLGKPAKTNDDSKDIRQITTGSAPFSCSVGKFEIYDLKYYGTFKAFKLKGSGLLINSDYLHMAVGTNEEITYMVPSSDSYIQNGKHISVNCSKSLSTGNAGVAASIDFYVPSSGK
jgi:hypothetical protein